MKGRGIKLFLNEMVNVPIRNGILGVVPSWSYLGARWEKKRGFQMLLQDCHALQRSKLKIRKCSHRFAVSDFWRDFVKIWPKSEHCRRTFYGILAALREIPDTCRTCLAHIPDKEEWYLPEVTAYCRKSRKIQETLWTFAKLDRNAENTITVKLRTGIPVLEISVYRYEKYR